MDLSALNRYLKEKRSQKISKDQKKKKKQPAFPVKINPKGLLGDEVKRQKALKEVLDYNDYEE